MGAGMRGMRTAGLGQWIKRIVLTLLLLLAVA